MEPARVTVMCDHVVEARQDPESDGDLRVVDESGEDYLFSANRFSAIEVPAIVKRRF